MAAVTFLPYKLLTDDMLNTAFADCVSLSERLPQNLAGNLNLPSLIALLSVQTQQLIVTGDALFSSSSAVTLPVGATLERPNLPQFGMIRANSDSGLFEVLLASGQWANVVTTAATTTPVNLPVSIASPAIGQATSNAIPIGWSVPQGGSAPFTYSVEFRLSGTSAWTTWVQETTATSTTISGLLNAARYDVRVSAFNAAGSVTSPVVSTNTLGFLPGGPTNLTASLATSTTMSLSWVPLAATAAYQVQYAAQGQSTWTTFGAPTINSNLVVTGLAPNTTYFFQVIAKTLGSSFESLVAQNATTVAATVAPNAPTGLAISGLTSGGWTISWQPPSAGTQPLSYAVQYQLAGTSTWTTYLTTTGLSATFVNMDSASAYNVQVVATNSSGNATSAMLAVTTLTVSAMAGSVAGTQNSGPGYPSLVAPFAASVVNGSALAISGITLIDPEAIYSSGTMVLKVTCSTGVVTMTDAGQNNITGSGTKTITYASTYAAVQTALASLVYTASVVGNDSINISVTDQLIRQASVAVDILVVQGSGTVNPPPPPGGSTTGSTTATGQPTDQGGISAGRIRSFLGGIGVNVRFEDPAYTGNYTQTAAASIENMINYLGGGQIKILRESSGVAMNPSWMSQIAANTGSKYIFFIGQDNAPANYSTIAFNMELAAQTFPAICLGMEGVYAADTTGNLAAAAQFQNQLFGIAHSVGLPCLQMTPQVFYDNTFGTPPADIGNAAIFPPFSPNGLGYPNHSIDQNGYLSDAVTAAKTNLTGTPPVALTSFGWQSFPDGTVNSGLGLVQESTQAAYILETFFSAYKLGMPYYIVNELLDAVPGQSIDDIGQTYGLFNLFQTQKRSAVAIHNMFSWMNDLNATGTSFISGKLDYTVGNKPTGATTNAGYQDVLFQRSSGDYFIVMWNEQALNTYGLNNSPLSVANVPVTLTFNSGPKSQVKVYDPIIGSVTSYGSTVNLSVSLPPYPIFIQVIF